jgi:hypothetical protein
MHCRVKDGKVIAYPYDFRRLALDHKNMVFSAHPTPAELAEFGVYRVRSGAVDPHDASTHKVVTADKPTLVNGKWTIVNTIVALSAEEIAERDAERAEDIRERRDALLANSDWTQGNDTPLDNVARQAWASYRQALRDITSQDGFPRSVTWPTEP